MEFDRCLVDKADWIYDVRLNSCSFIVPLNSLFLDILIRCFWDVCFQSSVLEISICDLFLGCSTISSFCCFS